MTMPTPRAGCRRPSLLLRASAAITLSAVSTLALMQPSEAAPRHHYREGGVVACSHYGRGCIRGPVRDGAVERQVRMPGGTWIGCKSSCSRTLREEALDYFETLRDRVWDN